MNTECGYANWSLIKSNKWELRGAGAWFSRVFITTLYSVATLLAPGLASGTVILYLSNSGGNAIETYDAGTGADLAFSPAPV
jgi:hypothetical protein